MVVLRRSESEGMVLMKSGWQLWHVYTRLASLRGLCAGMWRERCVNAPRLGAHPSRLNFNIQIWPERMNLPRR